MQRALPARWPREALRYGGRAPRFLVKGQCRPWHVSHPSLPSSVLPERVLIFPLLQRGSEIAGEKLNEALLIPTGMCVPPKRGTHTHLGAPTVLGGPAPAGMKGRRTPQTQDSAAPRERAPTPPALVWGAGQGLLRGLGAQGTQEVRAWRPRSTWDGRWAGGPGRPSREGEVESEQNVGARSGLGGPGKSCTAESLGGSESR